METKLSNALNNIEATYTELVQIANDITKPIFEPITKIITQINTYINNLSVDQIREYLLQLQLKAFEISDIKEKSALKAELANALQKEKFAITFNSLDGSAAIKDKLAQVEISGEIVAETLYNLVASLFKTKLDQCHRMVAVLTSILMSRMSEAKFMNLGSTEDVGQTYGNKFEKK